MNELLEHNNRRLQEIVRLRDAVRDRHAAQPVVPAAHYPLRRLRDRLDAALAEQFGRTDLEWTFDPIERARFGADFAVRVTSFLREFGAKDYIGTHAPQIVTALRDVALSDAIAEVSHKGIYVNIRLTDQWFLDSVQHIVDTGEQFGRNDTRADRSQVVDYSAPNVAKVLHAGHFRSTMIGHVLANLFEACGALVYRVNHINDFGGFGFMLEGYRRFAEIFPEELTDNERLLQIYSLRRSLERAAQTGLENATETDRELLYRYFPDVSDQCTAQTAWAEFTAAADRRFAALERGEAEEVELWQAMVQWSLRDFQSFYAALDIDIDFVIGESFYLGTADQVIEQALENGSAFVFTADRAATDIAALDTALKNEEITPQIHEKSLAQVNKDIGAVVVPLPEGGRLVVRRSDGRSIYATRDIGAIKARRDIFDPTDIDYVVGQEQQVHFSRVFAAARQLGIAEPEKPEFKHIYFGFYVDAETGRKLSSRESVTGVNALLAAAVTHFRKRSAESAALSETELDEAAQQLAVGSILFNDLRRDMKGPVAIPSGDVAPVLAEFEKSGGPYVVYSACRARSILRKYGKEIPRASDVSEFTLSDHETGLITAILELPDKIARAAADTNPSLLIRHLLDIAGIYNTYYASSPVLTPDGPNVSRLLITRATQLALTNGLALCHIACPSKI